MAHESVAKLLRIKTGRTTVTFERTATGVAMVAYSQGAKPQHVRCTLKESAIAALRELLQTGIDKPSSLLDDRKEPIRRTDFTMEEVPAERRTVPPEGLQGQQTEDGLVRSEDGIEAGME